MRRSPFSFVCYANSRHPSHACMQLDLAALVKRTKYGDDHMDLDGAVAKNIAQKRKWVLRVIVARVHACSLAALRARMRARMHPGAGGRVSACLPTYPCHIPCVGGRAGGRAL